MQVKTVKPTWSCLADAITTSSEWKLFKFDKVEVIDFEILLLFNLLIKNI